MSMKRSTGGRGMTRDTGDNKVDRSELYLALTKRAESNEPFAPADISQNIGASEAAVSRALLVLAAEGVVEKIDGGRFTAGLLKERGITEADLTKCLSTTAARDPKRASDLVELQRLKKNNDEMRKRLLEAVAERDRYLALLKKHNIDPAEQP
jgi:DNA-binding GntR family transcriptional regulator